MKIRATAAILLPLALLPASCTTDPQVQILEGRFFERVRLVAIHKGKTTKSDVLSLLGPPWRKTGPVQAEEWEYYVRYRRVPPKVLGIFSKGTARTMYRRMTIKFDKDVVYHVTREESAPGDHD